MFNTTSRGGLRPAARLAGAALALGLGFGGPAAAATCTPSSVTTGGGLAALGCGTERPFDKAIEDKIGGVEKGRYHGEVFFITVTRTKDRDEALEGTWSLLPGLSFAQGASYALALKGGEDRIFYTLDTSATSGTWSTADLLVGRKGNQAGLSDIRLYGTAAPVAPIPLPAAAWLLVGGIAGLGAVARRRMSAAA